MRRRPSAAWDIKPHKPIYYGLVARLADRWAGAKDGRAGMPALPGAAAAAGSPAAVTPYLEIRNRHFLDRSERERRHHEHDAADTCQQLQTVRQQIAAADAAVAEISKRLEELPAIPDATALASRNAVEQHADEALVRTRRQREHDAVRGKVVAQEREAVQAARLLRVEEARLAESVAARQRMLDCRVRQLHQHTLRRCGTYKRRLAHKHPDGTAVLPYLNLALPELPDWLQHGALGTTAPLAA
jgi:hypothetical protein